MSAGERRAGRVGHGVGGPRLLVLRGNPHGKGMANALGSLTAAGGGERGGRPPGGVAAFPPSCLSGRSRP